jgi:L-lactate dehydrogenase
MVEALTGGLSGFGRSDPKEGWGATINITLYDPEAFGGKKDFLRQMDQLADSCLENPPRPGVSKVRLPGHAGLAARTEQLKSGVRLHPTLLPGLAPFAERFGIAAPAPLNV